MTEGDWLSCLDSMRMLRFRRGAIGERKAALFVAACSRRLWKWLTHEGKYEIEAMEGHAEDLQQPDANGEALEYAFDVGKRAAPESIRGAFDAVMIAVCQFWEVPEDDELEQEALGDSAWLQERAAQALLVRDIVGNPFRPVAFEPSWRTATVVALAEAIYAERRFEQLPILADALEEAGCTSAELLNHCRSGGDHVRGCWAVDLVLDKI